MRSARRIFAMSSLACVCALGVLAQAEEQKGAQSVLRVCADPNNLPQSDKAGAGFENKLAEKLAQDLGRKLEYTFFPQRMGFVRNTLRARDETTQQYKCDLIIGVPKGYELTATTQPWMHSTYALIAPGRPEFKSLSSAEDLLKLPKPKLQSLRIGIFGRSPASDWLLRNGLIDRAKIYAPQSGDPGEHPANIIERDLEAGNIDVAAVWGPVAGFLASRHAEGPEAWVAVPFKPDPTIRFDYEISMGVRQGEKEWQDTLDKWITDNKQDIRQLLVSFKVPLLEEAPAAAAPAAHDGT